MILLPGLAIKIANEKKSESYRLLKGISSKNVYYRIQMTLKCNVGDNFIIRLCISKKYVSVRVYSDDDKTIADRFNQFFTSVGETTYQKIKQLANE